MVLIEREFNSSSICLAQDYLSHRASVCLSAPYAATYRHSGNHIAFGSLYFLSRWVHKAMAGGNRPSDYRTASQALTGNESIRAQRSERDSHLQPRVSLYDLLLDVYNWDLHMATFALAFKAICGIVKRSFRTRHQLHFHLAGINSVTWWSQKHEGLEPWKILMYSNDYSLARKLKTLCFEE